MSSVWRTLICVEDVVDDLVVAVIPGIDPRKRVRFSLDMVDHPFIKSGLKTYKDFPVRLVARVDFDSYPTVVAYRFELSLEPDEDLLT